MAGRGAWRKRPRRWPPPPAAARRASRRRCAWRSWARAARHASRASEPRSRLSCSVSSRCSRASSACAASSASRGSVSREQVLEPAQRDLGLADPAERVLAGGAQRAHPGRLLDEGAALGGGGLDDGVDVVLGDDGVAALGQPGGAEHPLDVAQPDAVAVEPELAVAVADDAPADRHLDVLDRQPAVLVVEDQLDLGEAHARAAVAARVDDLVHARAAQLAGVGLAERPADGVDEVALAAAVGADDGGDARLEGDLAAAGEGLEPGDDDAAQPHPVDSPGADRASVNIWWSPAARPQYRRVMRVGARRRSRAPAAAVAAPGALARRRRRRLGGAAPAPRAGRRR